MSKELLSSFLLVLSNAVVAGLGFAVQKAVGYFKTKNHNATVNGVLDRVSTLSLTVVKDVFQSYVGSLKTSGAFDAAAQAAAKNMAMESVKKYLGPMGLQQLLAALGSDTAVTSFLSTSVEAALVDLKAHQAASTTAPVTLNVMAAPMPQELAQPAPTVV